MSSNQASTFMSEVYAPSKIEIGNVPLNQINPPHKRVEEVRENGRKKLITTYTSMYQSSIPNTNNEYPIIQIKIKEVKKGKSISYDYVRGYNGTGRW